MRTKHFSVVSLIVLGLISTPAQATIYNLTFNNNSTLVQSSAAGSDIRSIASFHPITLFDGDTLSIVFNNVPPPRDFPQNQPSTGVITNLFMLGGSGVVDETVVIGGHTFGPLLMHDEGSNFNAFGFAGGLFFGPTWTISLQLLSGEPRAGPGCLNRISALISGASAGFRPPSGMAAG
jgi:hypothetical protein